ncbi:MAG: TetR/AcrR family transcriptional regulator [Thermomicrobiales bacterium]
MARKYELKRRAERQEQTRQRIVEATVALHGSVGAANTTISAIAERAGVERLTVYRHFPDERALFGACSAHWNAGHPAPDPEPWQAIPDPADRLHHGLTELYAWFRQGEPMIANSLRDAPAIPALMEATAPVFVLIEQMAAILAGGWDVPPDRRRLFRAAIGHALDFHAWRSLARTQDLTDDQAVALMTAMVHAAASGHEFATSTRYTHA